MISVNCPWRVLMFKVTILKGSCKGVDDCGICKYVCSKELFTDCKQMSETGYIPPEIIDEKACTGSQNCMLFCPDFAIIVEETENIAVPKNE